MAGYGQREETCAKVRPTPLGLHCGTSLRGACRGRREGESTMAMVMNGEVQLAAPRELVWAKLNDTEALKASIPGCETLEKLSDTEFQAVAPNKVGPVKARFKGKVRLSDLDPPNGYR